VGFWFGQFVAWHGVLVMILALQRLMQHNALWLIMAIRQLLGTSLVLKSSGDWESIILSQQLPPG